MTTYFSWVRCCWAAALVIALPGLPLLAQLAESDVPPAAVEPELDQEVERETTKHAPPSLGITVADSPGDGVLVTSVVWGGPAARAGIRTGDFILAAAGKVIATPADLSRVVRAADPLVELEIGVWRRGKEISLKVTLASRFADPQREKAWLGVVLQMTDGDKVLVADVMPMSPASRGGLRVGDAIVSVNAEQIDSVEKLLQLMERIKGGENVEVTVLRNGEERTFTIRVGSVVQRTMRWFQERLPGQDFRQQWFEFLPPEEDRPLNVESFEELMDRLRDEVKELQDEVRRLRSRQDVKDAAQDAPSDAGTSDEEPSVSNQNPNVMTVAMRSPQGRRGNRVMSYRNYQGGRPQVQYRYGYRRPNSYGVRQPYYAPAPRVFYYSVPTYYYSYPPAPYFYYYGPRMGVYVGPRFYWY